MRQRFLSLRAALLTIVAVMLAILARGAMARCAEAVQSEGQQLPQLQSLAPGVWWVSGERGDADPSNRGQVSNLLVVREQQGAGSRVWLLGSGPSPMWAQRLQCQISLVVGAPVTDVISPWAHPELVLGAKAFHARHWAHADVALGMRRECAQCIPRLRQRLGPAAVDLGSQPVDWPRHRLYGESGRLGPFVWHRFKRSRTTAVTVWHLPKEGLLAAHGLVWGGGVPDLRDTHIEALTAGLQSLQRVVGKSAGLNAIIGEQGPPMPATEVSQHLDYLRALQRQVQAGQAEGSDGVRTPAALAGLAASQAQRLQDPQHGLNWQRAWRHAEQAPVTVRQR